MKALKIGLVLLMILSLFSCSIVQRKYMPGVWIELRGKSKSLTRLESGVRSAELVEEGTVKTNTLEEVAYQPETIKLNPEIGNLKPVTTKLKPETESYKPVPLNPKLRTPHSVFYTPSPMDSFSVITMVLAFIICFFIPPFALLLAFGPGKDVNMATLLFLGGVFMMLGLVIYLISTPASMAMPIGFTVGMILAIGFFAASFLFSMIKLIRALFVKQTE